MTPRLRLCLRTFPLTVASLAVLLTPVTAQRASTAPTERPPRPRLVVVLVVDQMRADYVTLYGKQWKAGLHEIFSHGASFTEAAYPYAATKTCAGHSTIGTGTLPSTHGMVDNEWYDLPSRSYVTCTEDPSAQSMLYPAGTGTEHHSAMRLRVPTMSEQLAQQFKGRIVSIAGKARSAIGLGGHGGSSATIVWLEDAGSWATSSKLARERSPDVARFVKARPAMALGASATWSRFLPEAAYLFPDAAAGEPADNVFPHVFADPIRTARTTTTLEEFWGRTPALDNYLGALGSSLVSDLGLGKGSGTDFLGIGFSALDLVGHTYGPRSHEVQDVLARLDQTIGQLLSLLDRVVGRERYVLALSADHGVSALPEQTPGTPDAGRIVSLLPTATAIDGALRAALGPGRFVEAIAGAQIYFRPGVVDRIKASPAAIKAVESVVAGTNGLLGGYWGWDLAASTATSDLLLTKLRRSYMAGRSGDLTILMKPGWVLGAGANHGTPHDYDSRVPVVFYGAGIKPGQYTGPATPVDIAPTLAHLVGLTLSRTDGEVLRDAIAAP